MKVLVIPDVHLKPIIFHRAMDIMKSEKIDQAVCLMDIADDWNQELNLDLYNVTYDSALDFSFEFPNTLWCYGNHDVCYLWNQRETGYSQMASWLVCEKLRKLKESLPDERQLAFIHRIENILFSHAGLNDDYVRHFVPYRDYNEVDRVVSRINNLGEYFLWRDDSPIWNRPQYDNYRMYKPRKLLQVVGHTPIDKITRKGNLISCDVFSTYRDGRPIGTSEFLILETNGDTPSNIKISMI